jgi:hypothetical protein
MSGLGMMEVAQIDAQQTSPINVNFKNQKPARFRCWYFFAFAIAMY